MLLEPTVTMAEDRSYKDNRSLCIRVSDAGNTAFGAEAWINVFSRKLEPVYDIIYGSSGSVTRIPRPTDGIDGHDGQSLYKALPDWTRPVISAPLAEDVFYRCKSYGWPFPTMAGGIIKSQHNTDILSGLISLDHNTKLPTIILPVPYATAVSVCVATYLCMVACIVVFKCLLYKRRNDDGTGCGKCGYPRGDAECCSECGYPFDSARR